MAETLPNVSSVEFVEALYAQYLRNPKSTPAEWQRYFASLGSDADFAADPKLGPSFPARSVFEPPVDGGVPAATAGDEFAAMTLQDRVDQLIRSYRVRGHLIAQVDPLERPLPHLLELDPEFYGLTEEHMDRVFSTDTLYGVDRAPLFEILNRMYDTYCQSVGVQYMHIDDVAAKMFIQEWMERRENRPKLTRDDQLRILTRLTDAVIFEEFIQRKFTGAKSFSLEGAESLIPLLHMAIDEAGELGVEEIVFGMAHRGRLNVLVNIIGKSAREVFREFEDKDPELQIGRGDVKYHLGYSNDWTTSYGRRVHLTLTFNPSHLEFVNPVALGRVRAKQDIRDDEERTGTLPILIHGDAAFAAEGIVQETLNLCQLWGYTVGGALHIVVNNQIGFTTPPSQGRSTTYCTDVARMLQSPVFHVNGEDPEAVAQVVRLALEFRQTFNRDVFVDMLCYRRRGHNEGDEPAFTDPLLYKVIRKRKSVREGYLERLERLGEITRREGDEIAALRRRQLEAELSAARTDEPVHLHDPLLGVWDGYVGGPETSVPETDTGVPEDRLRELLLSLTRLPEDFHLHPTLKRWMDRRRAMVTEGHPLDWAAAEALALASLSTEGARIRLSGQDCERGTFSHRHAVLHDYEDGHTFTPLQHLSREQAPVEIHNSPLSEAGVLGFDYGYSLHWPSGLTIWEAQFGDFANTAQVVIDQFIASGEDKWQRLSGLVMLLPHGFEGMGPEHSSARLERYLALAAEDNIQVVQPTTPAQFFHVLRRAVVRPWRKPLIVMTPKSLLRHPRVVSPLSEMASGGFRRVLRDERPQDTETSRVLVCTGKVYYDLETERERRRREDVAIVRVEQLYPLRSEHWEPVLSRFPVETPLYWVQEEPANMGAWSFVRMQQREFLPKRPPFRLVSRPPSASPATGSANAHRMEQQSLLERAFEEE